MATADTGLQPAGGGAVPPDAPTGAVIPVLDRGRLLAIGIPVGLVGLAVLLVSMFVMTSAAPLTRGIVAFVGGSLLWYGLQQLGVVQFGPGFKLGLWVALGWIALVVLLAIFAGVLPIDGVDDPVVPERLARPALEWDEPLGRDDFGRSLLSRTIYGARVSLTVGIVSAAVGMSVGVALGLLAGFRRGPVDGLIGILTNATLAFPPLVLLLAVVSVMDPTVTSLSLALALLTIPTFTRLARAQTLVFAERDFVTAARSMGARNSRIALREILPNLMLPVASYTFLVMAVIIVAEGSLSYIGVGIQPPQPSWGGMIAKGQVYLKSDPHVVFVPCFAMFTTVLALNRVGEWARTRVSGRDAQL